MNNEYSTNLFNENCIYGELKDCITCVEDIVICEGCKMLIQERIDELTTAD